MSISYKMFLDKDIYVYIRDLGPHRGLLGYKSPGPHSSILTPIALDVTPEYFLGL